ncbi:hypothetical protein [Brevibacterium casei]
MRVRALAAAGAALVLLSSGLGTGARWYDEANFDKQSVEVRSGELKVTAAPVSYRVQSKYTTDERFADLQSCDADQGFARCAELSKGQVEDFRFMRGDRLTIASRFDVSAKGTNLRYAATLTSDQPDPPPAWIAEATVSPEGPLEGAQTITSTRTFDFTGQIGADAWPRAFDDLSVAGVSVAVVQEDR